MFLYQEADAAGKASWWHLPLRGALAQDHCSSLVAALLALGTNRSELPSSLPPLAPDPGLVLPLEPATWAQPSGGSSSPFLCGI